jgi:NAD(P)-dependent dehydrogenase (short-subunit alcohol dehydrogenase family)
MNYQVDYKGKKCVVTGAASGMGKSVVELLNKHGAEVYALDLKAVEDPVTKKIAVNLADKASIDAAVAELPDGIDSVFHVAGLPGQIYGGKPFSDNDVITVNYIGARHILEKTYPKLKDGASVVVVSSIAAFNWANKFPLYKEFVDIADWDAQVRYLKGKEGLEEWYTAPVQTNRAYAFSKEALCIYVVIRSWDLAARKIRLNASLPGATKTPMHDDFRRIVGGAPGSSMPVSPIGEESFPEQQASVMLALNSDMANYVSGQCLSVDFAMSNLMIFGIGKK